MNEDNMDWKDLEIGDIPRDFRENVRYEIQFKAIAGWEIDNDDRKTILHNLIDDEYKYRYCLKPLKSIRISKGLNDLLYEAECSELLKYCKYDGEWDEDRLVMLDNRKVEIIGDDE